jgi:hypothetical protein
MTKSDFLPSYRSYLSGGGHGELFALKQAVTTPSENSWAGGHHSE